MKLRFVSSLILVAVCLVSGCGSVNEAFLKGVDAYANDSGLLNEYDRYVDADPALAPETKKIRKDTAAGLRKLVAEAKKESE